MDRTVIRWNYPLCLKLEFVGTIFLGTSFMAVYYQRHGLTNAQIATLQSTIAIVGLVSDVPMGNLADRFGIRKVTILAYTIQTVSYAAFAMCNSFWQFELCVLGTALGWATLSGTLSSQIINGLATWRSKARVYRMYEHKAVQWRIASALVGVMLGGVIVKFQSMEFAFALQPFIYATAVFLATRLMELERTEVHRGSSINEIIKLSKMMLVESRSIRWLILHTAVMYTVMVGVFWQLQPKAKSTDLPLWSYSLFYNARSLFSLAIGWLDHSWQMSDRARHVTHLLVICLGVAASGLLSGVVGVALLFLAHGLASALVIKHFRGVLFDRLPDAFDSRTTQLSIASATQSLVFAAMSPLFGLLTDVASVNVTLLVIGGIGLVFGGLTIYLLYGVEPTAK